MIRFNTFLFSIIFTLSVTGQEPVIDWQFCHDNWYLGWSMEKTLDDAIIIGGINTIVKIHSTGNLLWEKTYSNSGETFDDFGIVRVNCTQDSGYIFCGAVDIIVNDTTHNAQYLVGKTDKNGELLWFRDYGGSDLEIANYIQQTKDTGYIVVGNSRSIDGDVIGNHGGMDDIWVLKLNKNGDIEWQRCIGGSGLDRSHSIEQTKDEGFIILGNSCSSDGDVECNEYETCMVLLTKISIEGDIEWNKCFYGNSENSGCEAFKVKQTNDGGYAFCGYASGDFDGIHSNYSDAWFVKTDSYGNEEWSKCFGGSDGEVAFSFEQLEDESYYIVASANSTDGDVPSNYGSNDFWSFQISKTGELNWSKCFGGSSNDLPTNSIRINDSTFVMSGSTMALGGDIECYTGPSSDTWLFKTIIVNNKISGNVNYSIQPEEDIELAFFNKNKYGVWRQLYRKNSSDQNGFELSGVKPNKYRIVVSPTEEYPESRIYTKEGYYGNYFEIGYNEEVERNIQLLKRIKVTNPDKFCDLVQIPSYITWVPIEKAVKYQFRLRKQVEHGYHAIINEFTNNSYFEIGELNIEDYGFVDLIIDAYDEYDNHLGRGGQGFYVYKDPLINSQISNDTIWDGIVVIKNDILVKQDVTLKIMPGTLVFFDTLDVNQQKDKFSLTINGRLIAEGIPSDFILFTSYRTGSKFSNQQLWEGLKIYNSNVDTKIRFAYFNQAEIGVELLNSTIQYIANSSIVNNKINLKVANSSTIINRCNIWHYGYENNSSILITNDSECQLKYCNLKGTNSYYKIQLENCSTDIKAENCYWGAFNIDESIYDYYDNQNLGKVSYEPTREQPINITKGVEEIIENNLSRNSPSDSFRILGIPDNEECYLNYDENLVLDFGENGNLVNGDSTDLVIFGRNYSNITNLPIMVSVEVSNSIEGSWEFAGMIDDNTEIDISKLNQFYYRYLRITNFSESNTTEDSIGVFLDAVVSVHDTLQIYRIEDQWENDPSLNLGFIKNYPNPFSDNTTIEYFVPRYSEVEIKLLDIKGRKIVTILNKYQNQGTYKIEYNINELSNGIYFLKYSINEQLVGTHKMIILK